MRIGPLNTGGNISRTGKPESGKSSASSSGARSAAAPQDAASIMGVPENELTPNVQRALLSLMGEVDQMRKEAEEKVKAAKGKEAMLQELQKKGREKDQARVQRNAERISAELERMKGEAERVVEQENAIARRPGGRELMSQLRAQGYVSPQTSRQGSPIGKREADTTSRQGSPVGKRVADTPPH